MEVITKEQLYKLLHISKRKAKYLLDNGIIPCVDSGKKTRKYTIKMSDVRAYIATSKSYVFQEGIFSSIAHNQAKNSWAFDEKALRNYYAGLLKKKPDILLVCEIVDITGYTNQTVYRWISKGFLTPIRIGCNILISKQELIRFLASKKYNSCSQKSQKHLCELEKIAIKEQQM